jgi:hypothetical protein
MARRKHHYLDRAIGNVRTGTNREDLSPEAQRHAIEQLAARHRATVVGWTEDAGVSGTTPPPERDGFVDALDPVDRFRAGTQAVARLDRLSRSSMDYAVVAHDLEQHRRRLVTADGVGNEGTAASRPLKPGGTTGRMAGRGAGGVDLARGRLRPPCIAVEGGVRWQAGGERAGADWRRSFAYAVRRGPNI